MSIARLSSSSSSEDDGEEGEGMSIIIRKPKDADVLFGRGAKLLKHPGNVKFRKLIQDRLQDYAGKHSRKTDIAKEVIWTIHTGKGRFLQRHETENEDDEVVESYWVPVYKENVVIEKIKQNFRDASNSNNNNNSSGNNDGDDTAVAEIGGGGGAAVVAGAAEPAQQQQAIPAIPVVEQQYTGRAEGLQQYINQNNSVTDNDRLHALVAAGIIDPSVVLNLEHSQTGITSNNNLNSELEFLLLQQALQQQSQNPLGSFQQNQNYLNDPSLLRAIQEAQLSQHIAATSGLGNIQQLPRYHQGGGSITDPSISLLNQNNNNDSNNNNNDEYLRFLLQSRLLQGRQQQQTSSNANAVSSTPSINNDTRDNKTNESIQSSKRARQGHE